MIHLDMGKLDRADDTAPYLRLKTKIEKINNDPRYTFMFSEILVSDTMATMLWSNFRMPG